MYRRLKADGKQHTGSRWNALCWFLCWINKDRRSFYGRWAVSFLEQAVSWWLGRHQETVGTRGLLTSDQRVGSFTAWRAQIRARPSLTKDRKWLQYWKTKKDASAYIRVKCFFTYDRKTNIIKTIFIIWKAQLCFAMVVGHIWQLGTKCWKRYTSLLSSQADHLFYSGPLTESQTWLNLPHGHYFCRGMGVYPCRFSTDASLNNKAH